MKKEKDYKSIITLIAAYIITADKEIDNKELDIIYAYNKNYSDIENEINNIFSDDDNKILLIDLVKELSYFPNTIIYEAYNLFLDIIYSDGFCHIKEQEKLKEIKKILPFDDSSLAILELSFLEKSKKSLYKEEKKEDDMFYKKSSNDSDKSDEKKRDILLNGPQFVQKIKQISKTAKFDLKFVEEVISESSNRIVKLINNLENNKLKNHNRKDEEFDGFVSELQRTIKETFTNHLQENIQVLNKKKRSVDYFTISFLGRTKAGKSTLHSIITKDGDDTIGVGKVRTTRYNRVYNWENLRIVDTPGIGAPGGMSDVEIAESIVDESDLICYLVTNDAIQETEFQFLSEIKKKNKPVVILLNVKENLEIESRKNLFLKNPTRWRERRDNKSIQGHIERINDYMIKYYNSNHYRVIPVMLLASKLSEIETDDSIKKILYDGSNVEEFLISLKTTVFENGHLRKSQNIIDGTNFKLNSFHEDINNQYLGLSEIISRLKKEKKSFRDFLKKNKDVYKQNLKGKVETHISKIKKFARDFAINNYELSETKLTKLWEKELLSRGYKQQLEKMISEDFDIIQTEIQSRLNEFLESFQLYFNNLNLNIKKDSTFNTRSFLKIGGGLIGVVGAIFLSVATLSNPIGWTLAIGGILVGLSNYLFKSKANKIKDAQEKIEKSLMKGIEDFEIHLKKQIFQSLDQMLFDYDKSVDDNMGKLIIEAEAFQKLLKTELDFSKSKVDVLNKAMMIRVLQHIKHLDFDFDVNKFVSKDKTIIDIQRDFKKNQITLKTSHQLERKDVIKISELLQCDFKVYRTKIK
ncbi:GTPase [Flavobacterium piscisymbiosum]|uniref:50S ribosome-binding GTPase n=1 Tax=Flavobacterium piscisymbiosum TaxID=2893753 RepID=A0ABS8MF36_9FLAO|nr:GTPase [Flavobacterium sp. F-30]MCC9063571.1 50S ribosome-binding GTPase [Flavobacterium sp. F-30]